MTESKFQEISDKPITESRLNNEGRLLYIDFMKALLAIPDFKNSFIAQSKANQKRNRLIEFMFKGQDYRVEVCYANYPYDVLKITERDEGSVLPNRRLQIQLPVHGYPDKSSIIYFGSEDHSDFLGSYPVIEDDDFAIKNAREFLRSLSSV